jgi:hypothetical protein
VDAARADAAPASAVDDFEDPASPPLAAAPLALVFPGALTPASAPLADGARAPPRGCAATLSVDATTTAATMPLT